MTGEDDSSPLAARNDPTSDLICLLLEEMKVWVQLVERDPEIPHVASENETNILHWIESHQQEYLDRRNNISDLEKTITGLTDASEANSESMERTLNKMELDKNEETNRKSRLKIRIQKIELEIVIIELREKDLEEMKKRVGALKEAWEKAVSSVC
ncbi:hypothetical protein BCIN_12g01730 [Botrytis cinerea B05.10]|uniref:Uncharacterized protein n=1 Tax=Botryotinia fuckeliana (strain B05.10) TaxID=332648 RepID=A0A384JYJ2_BOTFB|nr:hypothetical protein BCIN_12g01730 [Botrytis cinerea B05.10]ATZ55592.1 hypothetical protein BCIN_12g01730 [Botrytis cinerea B05.10]